jgi:hypothetical protein
MMIRFAFRLAAVAVTVTVLTYLMLHLAHAQSDVLCRPVPFGGFDCSNGLRSRPDPLGGFHYSVPTPRFTPHYYNMQRQDTDLARAYHDALQAIIDSAH